MSSEVQVFLPKFRNKQTFDELAEDTANNASLNYKKKTIIDVISPHKDLDQELASEIISIKPQTGSIRLKKKQDPKYRSPSSISRQHSPSKMIDLNIELPINQLMGYHKNRLYQDYKYKSIKNDFDKDLLNNSCDVVSNTKVKSKIRDLQYNLYHKKHLPLFELTQENINSLTVRQNHQIELNLQKPISSSSIQQLDQLEDSNNQIEIQQKNTNQTNDLKQFIDQALIKTMKNSENIIKSSQGYYKQKISQGSQKHKRSITIDKFQQDNPLNTYNYPDSQRSNYKESILNNQFPYTAKSNHQPIFSLDYFSGDMDQIHGIAKMASKGKVFTENFVKKDLPPAYPATKMNYNEFQISPSQSNLLFVQRKTSN